MTQKNILRGVGAAIAVAALAVAGAAVSSGSNSPSNAATPPSRVAPNVGTPATGAAAEKAKAAALAKYPGQVERVMKTSSGYEVHVIKSDGSEVHVGVSANFKVTGTESGPAGGPRGGQPPSGTGQTT